MRWMVVAIALIAMGALALVAIETIPGHFETELKQRASNALAAANLPFAKVSVRGRELMLTGDAPSPAAKDDAIKVAGDVWGVSSVRDALTVNGVATTTVASAEPSASVAHGEATPPPQEEPSNPPIVPGLVDPALAPPVDDGSTESAPTPSEPPAASGEAPPAQPVPQSESPPAQTTAEASPAQQSAAAEQPKPTDTSAAQATATEQPKAVEPPAPPPQFSSQPADTAAAVPVTKPQPEPATPAPTPAPAQVSAAPSVTPAPAPAPAPATPAPAVAAQATPAPPSPPPAQQKLAQAATAALSTGIQAVTPPPAPVAVEPPAYRLEAHVEGRRVELQGLVSTPSAQRALVVHVRRSIHRAVVVDSLQVAHTKPDKAWLSVARKGLTQLAHLDTGSLHLDGQSVAVSGKPKSERDRSRVLAALNELPTGYKSTVLLERMQDVPPAPAIVPPARPVVAAVAPPPPAPAPEPEPRRQPKKPAAHIAPPPAPKYREVEHREPEIVRASLSADCRYRFNDVLGRVAVVFDTGSARLQSSATRSLDDFARIAKACPQARIRLTGHTDTQEAPTAEMALSRQRALSVREALEQRGVPGDNITITGRGGLRPAFSNATADGRENNRRVEFAVW